MDQRNYNYSQNYQREVPPPKTNYSGSSPPHRFCLYLDFDNIYGGCLDYLGIRTDESISPLQFEVFSRSLECFLRRLSLSFPGECAVIKAFAEYENLPHIKVFNPGIQIFLHNIGIKPINPFVSSGKKKKKNKNASDIALTLEVVNDLIVKRIPTDSVVICSGDIDFYPLISWIREHTDKNVYIMSFSKRTNKLYTKVFDFSQMDKIINIDNLLMECLTQVLDQLSSEYSKYSYDRKFEWLKEKVKNLLPQKYNSIKDLGQTVIQAQRAEDERFNKFMDKVLEGLKNWLKNKDHATTGLIIRNWLPRWNLNLTIEEANEFLVYMIENGDLERKGFKFEGTIERGIAIGTIRRM